MRHRTNPNTHQSQQTQPPGHRSDEGLSLVEMVVAIGIVMVVLTSALSVFVLAKKSQQTAEGTDQASQIAYDQIERIRQLDWTDIGFQSAALSTAQGSTRRSATSTTQTDYFQQSPDDDASGGATIASGECFVVFGTSSWVTPPCYPATGVGTSDIKPYQTVNSQNNTFRVYTAITYGRNAALGLPTTSATTGTGQYTFKRVTVTVRWRASGNGTPYSVVAESWFAPEAEDAVPPGVPCLIEEPVGGIQQPCAP